MTERERKRKRGGGWRRIEKKGQRTEGGGRAGKRGRENSRKSVIWSAVPDAPK